MSKCFDFSVVIATLNRPDSLLLAVKSLLAQTVLPTRIIVVDSTEVGELQSQQRLLQEIPGKPEVMVIRAKTRSAADQRNQGFEHCSTPYVLVIDDDVVLDPDVCSKLLEYHHSGTQIGAVAARERGTGHTKPGRLLRFYYKIQAGYDDPSYGGRLFGPGVNCLPCYDCQVTTAISTEWLPSTCLMTSRRAFDEAGGFPAFQEYSFMEDVWLTASMCKAGFHLLMRSDALFDHHSQSSTFKKRRFKLARMRIAHRRRLAREVMETSLPTLEAKLTLHKAFDSIYLLRQRPEGWLREIIGTWLA